MPTKVTTAVGRIVWGNPLNGRAKTDDNNQPIIGKDGQQVIEYSFGLAIPKDQIDAIVAPSTMGLNTAMQQEAAAVFPNGAPPSFAWKIVDGDGIDNRGNPYNTRTGYAGHYVVAVSTQSFAPRCYRYENGSYIQINEGIKTGDYVQVGINVKGHTGNPSKPGSKPGLYMNPDGILLVGYGEEIISGPDPDSMFAGAPALPPGASATPMAPTGAAMPTAAPMGQPGAAVNPTNPAPTQTVPVGGQPMATPAAGAPVQPAHDFVANAGQPVAGQPAQPQPGQPGTMPPGYTG